MDRNQRCHDQNCSVVPGQAWPHQTTGTFKVMTVAHVVFDDDEAKNTKISFFFDDERSTGKCQYVYILMTESGQKYSWCSIISVV